MSTALLLLLLAVLAIGGAEFVRSQCRRMLARPARLPTTTQPSLRYRDAA
jgi:hypothetical protein